MLKSVTSVFLWYDKAQLCCSRYLLYDVNPGEGFNLRRDVYMRVANLVRNLNKDAPWVLVLPPWGRLYHWKSRHLNQISIPWSLFFDLPSLRRFVPVIEFEEFLKCVLSILQLKTSAAFWNSAEMLKLSLGYIHKIFTGWRLFHCYISVQCLNSSMHVQDCTEYTHTTLKRTWCE